ncbi:RING finger protein 112 isoform X2 [Alligator sinensis]|uniref:RING finger protein 112 isoform X2 n=1 Tax=Alligator sinensis TaxID=38654 RepID=A0A3Q0G0E8_ALLSI|nr:RING finger protein 112 isoform X2 [Alligator sinensis]
MEGLWEDVSCSICLDILDNPVSIKCGHNFCHQCLSKYWDEVLAQGEVTQCPECRQPCARDHVMPDTRLRSVVEKIIEMEQKAPPALPEPIKAVQVMDVDKDQHLLTNEEALSCCLEQETVRSSPVCLISIIGEQRGGKSFLMSHLLRQLRHQEASDNSWMTWEEEAESSFPFRDGMDTVTKGVWMWPQPLWVQGPQGKVAVFLVDTEGSLDLQQHMETSIKLCVFSILLSSYQIFNISSKFKRSEEDYLEMFIKVTREVGNTCNLNPLQHLDLLVRDWQLSHDYGAEGGRKYLDHIQVDLRKSPGHDTVLQVLQAETTQCYLLPHPGMQFIGRSEGTLADMSEPFRHHLRAYVTGVVDSAGTSFRTNSKGNVLTGGELMERIKMAKSFANIRTVQRIKEKYSEFLQEQDESTQAMVQCLKVKLSKMRQHLDQKLQDFKQKCEAELQGKEAQKQEILKELEKDLGEKMEAYLKKYQKRYRKKAMMAGLAVGGSALALAGGAIGAVTAGMIAAEVTVMASGAAVGAGGLGAVGAGVGAAVARFVARRKTQNTTVRYSKGTAGEGEVIDDSENMPLLRGVNG